MDWLLVVKAAVALGGLGLVIAVVLVIASIKLAVKVDEREASIRAVLPGANCGACGFPGCDGYAAAVAAGTAPPNSCSVGGASVARAIGEITGQDAGVVESKVAVLICRGGKDVAPHRFQYKGRLPRSSTALGRTQGLPLRLRRARPLRHGLPGYGHPDGRPKPARD